MTNRWMQVHPELFIGTFKCNDCGETVKNVEQQFKYTKPVICPNNPCWNRGAVCCGRSRCQC